MSANTLGETTDRAVSNFQSLRNLRRAVALLSLLVVLFGAAYSWFAWRAEYERQVTQITAVVEMGGEALNSYLGSVERALRMLELDLRGADGKVDLNAAGARLRSFKKINQELRIAILIGADGQILATSDSVPGESLPTLAEEPSFLTSREELRRGARLSIGRAFVGRVSGEWIIPVRYSMRGRSGELEFILGLGLPTSQTYSFWKDAPLPPGAALGLTRDDMYIVSRHPVPADTELKNLFGYAQKGALARHLQETDFPRSGIVDGVSSVSSSATVFVYRRLRDYPLTFYLNMPKSNVWAAWWWDMRILYLLIIVSVVAALALYRWTQKQQQAWEMARETRLRLAIDAAQAGIWTRDFQKDTVEWSPEFKQLLGYAPEELRESSADWSDRLHPDDREPVMARLRDAGNKTTPGHYETEMRLRHRDGSYRTFLSRAVPLHDPGGHHPRLLGTVVDITERKRAEETLRQSEQNLSITLQSIGDAVIATGANGLIVRMNPAAEHLTGWPFAEAAGRPLAEIFRIVHAVTRVPSVNPVQRVMERGEIVGLANHTALIARDGREYQIADSAAPIRDRDGRIVGVVLVFSDVTERYQMEAQLRANEQRLRSIIENEPQCVKIVSAGGNLLEMNAAGLAMLEATSLEDVTSRPLLEFIAPEYRAAFGALHQRVVNGERGTLEFEIIGLRGTRRWLETHAAPLPDAASGTTSLLGVTQDVTVRKQAEQAQAQLAAIVETSNDAIVSRAPDDSIVSWNAAAERLFGWSAKEVLGRSFRTLLSLTPETSKRRRFERVMQGEVVPTLEDIRRRKDGSAILVDTTMSVIRDKSGSIMLISCIMRDVTERKRVEEARARLAAIVENSNDAIFSRTLDGTILSWNAGAEKMLGYTAADVIGKQVDFTASPERPSRLAENNEKLLRGEVVAYEDERMTKDGRIITVLTSYSPLRDAAGQLTGASVIAKDITALKQAEAAAKVSEARFHIMFDQAAVGMALIGLDLRYIVVNQKFADMTGYSRDALRDRAIHDIGYSADADFDETQRQRLLSGEIGSLTAEHRLLRRNGNVFWARRTLSVARDEQGRAMYFVGVKEDITARKEIEERYRTTFDNAPVGIMHTPLEGYMILRVNRKLCEMLGYTECELLGMNSFELVHPDFRFADKSKYRRQLVNGEFQSFSSERKYLRKDGTSIWANRTLSLVNDAAGRPLYFIRIIEDISQRKAAEAVHASLEAQLRESQKMEAIGTLAGGIAHDFNNIIATILGNTALARQDVSDNSSTAESLEEIRKAGTRARDLVQQILAFSRRQPMKFKQIDLAPIVMESARLLRAALPARLTLEPRCEPGVPDVLADATQIQQALLNLATNAMQSISAGPGQIDILLERVVLDASLAEARPALRELCTKRPGYGARLTVRDTGVGMDAATLGRIFEPFFTTKPAGEGTGLGLSVVHGIVERHGGAIVADSQPGRGTAISLYLPGETTPMPEAVPEARTDETVAPNSGAGKHVLYVDDDEALVFLVKRLLERKGYRISAHSGWAPALEALRARPADFDLVVSDYNMPGMSGLEVALQVHAVRADLPVAVTSGFIDENLHAMAAAAGVSELIFKATDVEVYCATVERLARSIRQKAQTP